MSAAANAVPAATYGVITLDGQQFIERFQIFTLDLAIRTPGQVYTNQRLTLPGVANFLLKGMARDHTIPFSDLTREAREAKAQRIQARNRAGLTRDAQGSVDRRWRFRVLNQEGSTAFFSGGLGMYDDRVIDSLCFGSGQFPYPIIPPVPIQASGTLIFEVEDMILFDQADPDYYPYMIHFAFIGSYLIPVNQAQYMQSFIYQLTPGGAYGTLQS